MKIASFRIVGNLPGVMMHSPQGMKRTDEAVKATVAGRNIPSAADEAENGAYRLSSGQLYIPAVAFRSAMIHASKGRKFGKVFARSLIASSVFEVGHSMFCPLVHPRTGKKINEYEIDIRRVVIGKSGVMRARPLIQEWECTLHLEYDDERIDPDQILEILKLAGRMSGVLECRPNSPNGVGGPYGRFTAEIAAPQQPERVLPETSVKSGSGELVPHGETVKV